MLLGVGISYYLRIMSLYTLLLVSTYRIEELHRLILVNRQQTALTGSLGGLLRTVYGFKYQTDDRGGPCFSCSTSEHRGGS
jgi:hypothetical protein